MPKRDKSKPPSQKDKLLFISLFFGMFGADRFYMGEARNGSLKLLTFGGCGIWWLVDLLLIILDKLPTPVEQVEVIATPMTIQPIKDDDYYTYKDACDDFCKSFGVGKPNPPLGSRLFLEEFFKVMFIRCEAISRQEILKDIREDLSKFNKNLSDNLVKVAIELWKIGRPYAEPSSTDIAPYLTFSETYKEELFNAYVFELEVLLEANKIYYNERVMGFKKQTIPDDRIKEAVERIKVIYD